VADLETLQQLGRTTFFETFAAANTEENMATYLEQGFSREKLTRELSNPHSAFYLAERNGRAVGYLKVNTGAAQTELRDDQAMEIERIYVLKDYHGAGVGQALFEKALHLATEAGVSYVWLGVWEKNTRAIAFYTKNGFTAFDKHVFTLGNDQQTDVMMKFPL
jgi:ribosomal protein S18 acetylase RimI-like enzyme